MLRKSYGERIMKYIRVNDGIRKVFRKLKDGFYLVKVSKYKYYHYYPDCKVADTIEELVDEYVLVEKSARCFLNYDEITEDDLKLCLQDHDIFGAIWTDKGLIYVAKMNEKGELELL